MECTLLRRIDVRRGGNDRRKRRRSSSTNGSSSFSETDKILSCHALSLQLYKCRKNEKLIVRLWFESDVNVGFWVQFEEIKDRLFVYQSSLDTRNFFPPSDRYAQNSAANIYCAFVKKTFPVENVKVYYKDDVNGRIIKWYHDVYNKLTIFKKMKTLGFATKHYQQALVEKPDGHV